MSAAAIHKIEQSGMTPTITTLLKVAGALGRPVSYFVDEEEPSDPTAYTRTASRADLTSHTGIDLAGITGAYGRFFSPEPGPPSSPAPAAGRDARAPR